MPLVDEVHIDITAGDGGDGCISFRREKYVPRGGPDGGDGGQGGDVVLVASDRLTTLLDFHYKRQYKAGRGTHGRGKGMTGADGDSVVLEVPVGTVVADEQSGDVLGDLETPGSRVIVAHGGRGGRGNARFATPTTRAPRKAEPGGEGEHRRIVLTLKLLADVGLVGLPNAGKSTLLAALSAARPKIAEYPFTTVQPNLGVVSLGGYQSCVIADIPGLIEGAHAGQGLGHQFLRHIERTRVLIHLLDISDPAVDVVDAWRTIRAELTEYGAGCKEKPEIVVLTKIDTVPNPQCVQEKIAEFTRATGIVPLAISAVAREGLEALLQKVSAVLSETETAQDATGT